MVENRTLKSIKRRPSERRLAFSFFQHPSTHLCIGPTAMPIFVSSSNTLALYIERAISYSPFASLSTRVLDVDIRPGTLAVSAIGGLVLLFLVYSYLWPHPPPASPTLLSTPPSRFEIDSRWFEKFMDSLPLFEFLMSKYQLSAEDSITWNEDIRNAITR